MPLQSEYYTDDAKISEWLDGIPGVYPPEAKEVLDEEYVLKDSFVQPDYIKNSSQLFSEVIDAAMGAFWNGELTAQEATDQIATKGNPLLQGVW